MDCKLLTKGVTFLTFETFETNVSVVAEVLWIIQPCKMQVRQQLWRLAFVHLKEGDANFSASQHILSSREILYSLGKTAYSLVKFV